MNKCDQTSLNCTTCCNVILIFWAEFYITKSDPLPQRFVVLMRDMPVTDLKQDQHKKCITWQILYAFCSSNPTDKQNKQAKPNTLYIISLEAIIKPHIMT